MDLSLKPKNQHILGKIVDVMQSKGGIMLPTSNVKNVTVFVLVKHVGPDVKNCKVGDIVLYLRMNHLWLRDGTHWCQVKDEDVICTVEDLDMSLFAVEGETRADGQPYNPTPPPSPTA